MSAIRRNLSWLLITQLATWLISAVAVILVPRYLNDEELGVFAFAVAVVGFLTLIASLGTSTLLAREIARDHALLGPYVYNAVPLKILLSTVLSALALATAAAFGSDRETFVLIALGCAGMIVVSVGEIFYGALAGLERMAKPAIWATVQVYVANAVGLAVLALGGGVVLLATVLALSQLIPAVATAIIIRPMVRDRGHLDPAIWRWLVRAGLPLTALTFSNLVYGTVDIPILKFIASTEDVGWYTLALRWIGIPAFISTAVAAAFYPSFSSLAKTSSSQFAAQVNKAVLLVLLAAVPSAIGLGVVAEDLIRYLYRPEWESSIVLMQILAVGIPLTAVDTILASALIAADRPNRYILVAASAALLNPVACLFAISITDDRYGNGAIGAAIVTVGTEMFIMVAAFALRSPGVLDRATVLKGLRITAAGLVMGAVVFLVGDLPLGVQVAIGIIVYAAMSVVLRTFAVGDLRAFLPRGLASAGAGGAASAEDGGATGQVDAPGGDDSHVGGEPYAPSGRQDSDRGHHLGGE